ncbi:MAG: hypothetical protein ACOYIG_12410, partial [Acetivibrionales bacterium]
VAMGYTGELSPIQMAVERTVDTLLGIIIAVPLNALLPNRYEVNVNTPVSTDDNNPTGSSK